MHNFELSDEQSMILDSVHKFAEEVAVVEALERDEHRQFVRASFDALAELGLYGMLVSEDSGGAGLGYLSLVVAVEDCARVCGSSARLLSTQAGTCAAALDGLADGVALLEAVLTGDKLCSFIDAGIVTTVDGVAITVDGAVACVTGGAEADVFLVVASIGDEAALVAVEADGALCEAVPALGFRATAPARVTFTAAGATVIARGAAAIAAIGRARLADRIGAAALAVGSAFGAVDHARRHAGERHAFGKPLLRQQAVGHKLVESRRRIEAARHLVYHAARLADAGDDASATALMACLTAVEAAVYAADEAIQILGGYGFTVEYHVERHYRDAKALEVLVGGVAALRDQIVPHWGY